MNKNKNYNLILYFNWGEDLIFNGQCPDLVSNISLQHPCPHFPPYLVPKKGK